MKWLKKLDPSAYNVITVLHESIPNEYLELIFLTKKYKKGLFNLRNQEEGLKELEQLNIPSKYILDLNGKIRTIIGELGIISLSIPVNNIVNDGFDIIADKLEKIGLANDSFTFLNSSKKIIMDEKIEMGDGTGIKVGVVDTGVDYTHQDLNVSAQFDVTIDSNYPNLENKDVAGHGTHVAGIIAGKGKINNDLKGVAAGADVISAKVFSNLKGGGTNDDYIIYAITKCITDYEVDIINLSIGSLPCEYNPKSEGFKQVSFEDSSIMISYNRIRQNFPQVVMIAAAGNNYDYGTINIPGEYESFIAAGSVTKENILANYSSKGPARDGRIKPDIVAPGSSINSTRSSFSILPYLNNNFKGNEYYTCMSGTSMATPHVVGITAILLKELAKQQKYSGKDFDRHELIKHILYHTAVDLGLETIEQGAGLVNLPSAIDLIKSGKEIEPIKLTSLPLQFKRIEPKAITEFEPFKTIIPYSRDLSDKTIEISTLAKNMKEIQEKYILGSIGSIGKKLQKAVLNKETQQGLATFRYNIPINRLQIELQDIKELEEIHVNYSQNDRLFKAMTNALSIIEELKADRNQLIEN